MALKTLSPSAQKQVAIKATYANGDRKQGNPMEGTNAKPPKVTNVGNNKTVKAKPQAGVSPRKN